MQERIVEGKDGVKVLVRRPNYKDRQDSQLEYNRIFRKALEGKAMLRAKLVDHMREQGVWNDEKQKRYDHLVEQIKEKELLLKKGGVRLSVAKEAALACSDLRAEFRELISERTSLDSMTAEGQADNAKFDFLVVCCLVNADTKEKVFKDLDDYYARSEEEWVIKAASELGSLLYDLDPEYEKNLPENKFLSDYKFVDDQLRLINKQGHLVDRDGRLVDEEGRYVKYNEAGEKVFVTRDGDPVDVEFTAFLPDEEEGENQPKVD